MISIIIRALNEAKYLGECLEAITKQKISEPYEIILVDSGSEDDTIKIAKSYDLNIVHIKKEEFSFGRSLNVGCGISKGQICVFISAHCIPTSQEWLVKLVQPLRDGICEYSYGRQISRDGVSKFSEGQVFNKYYSESSSIPQNGYFCNNANAAVLQEVWLKYKFDNNLTGLEDMAFAKSLLKDNGNVAYVSESVVEHLHEETWGRIKIRYEREAIALDQIDPHLNLKFIETMYCIIVSVYMDIMASGSWKFSRLMEIMLFRTCQFWGSFVGSRVSKNRIQKSKKDYFYPKP